MPIEPIAVDLDPTTLFLVRGAADAARMSVPDWMARALRGQAVQEAAATAAESELLHPDEPPGWADVQQRLMFGIGDNE